MDYKDKQRIKLVLANIEDILLEENVAASVLWDILVALRGPDNKSEAAKEGTIEIRAKAFPGVAKEIASRTSAGLQISNCPCFATLGMKKDIGEGGYHFKYHYERALESLFLLDEPTPANE